MSDTLRPARGPRRWARLLDRVGAAALVAVAGFVLGQQFVTPNKRVIPVLAAILLFGLAWRADMATGIGVLLLALPFPRWTSFGTTTSIFVLLLLVIWLLRVTTRQSRPPDHTPIDVPLVALFTCYVLSFYNIEPGDLSINITRFVPMVSCWLMFYLIVSNLRTEREFRLVLVFSAVSMFSICLVALYEVTHPGVNMRLFIASPLQSASVDESLANIRAGSVFFDYELLCEYCALSAMPVVFLLARSRTLLPQLAYGGLLVFLAFVLFTTVTRGGLVSLAIGVLYLLWMVRRRLTFVATTVALTAVIVGAIAMNAYVAGTTHSGNLFERLLASQVKGLVPDTRAEVWPAAWERIFQHPLIGHGPYFSGLSGTRIFTWPHSLYLYVANNVGFIGLAVFLWLLWTLFRMTRPLTDDLRRGDYVSSYLLVARAQMVIFLVDETKIEYLRNDVYQYQVWLMFALMAAANRIALTTGGRAAAGAPRRVTADVPARRARPPGDRPAG